MARPETLYSHGQSVNPHMTPHYQALRKAYNAIANWRKRALYPAPGDSEATIRERIHEYGQRIRQIQADS